MKSDQILQKLFNTIEAYQKTDTVGKVSQYKTPKDLKSILDLDDEEGTQNWNQVFEWVDKYLKYSIKTNHPQFLNRMWTGVTMPSLVGDFITTIAHTSACTYESAPVSTEMEKYMIQKMLDLVGFENGEGQMTTGSSNANMIAMMAARNLIQHDTKKKGLWNQKTLVAFVNEEAHYSMDKAVNILGIGTENLIKVAVNEDGSMNMQDLEVKIKRAIDSDKIPFFVGATVGTTMRGAYDPLSEILKLRDKYNFWLHADGAWGGSVFLNPKLRKKYLQGLEEIDSFTWDFHKMHGISLICNILLFNGKPGLLSQTCGTGDTNYIFRGEDQGVPRDLGTSSLQCGRRVDILKLFLNWKFYGQEGISNRLDYFFDMCASAEEIVRKTPELEMMAPKPSFNVCFRFKTPDNINTDEFNLALRTKLYHDGISLVGFGYIKDVLTLRLLICNHDIKKSDIDTFFHNLVSEGNELLKTFPKK